MELGTLWESSGGIGGGDWQVPGVKAWGQGRDGMWNGMYGVLTTAAIDCRQDYGRRRHPGGGLKGGGCMYPLCWIRRVWYFCNGIVCVYCLTVLRFCCFMVVD